MNRRNEKSSVEPQSSLECWHPATLICRSSSRRLLILEPSLWIPAPSAALVRKFPISFFPRGALCTKMLLCFCLLPCLTARKNGASGAFSLSRSVTAKYIVILHWASLRVGCMDFGLKWSLVTIFLAFSASCAFFGEPNKHFPAINGIFLEGHITPT